MTLNIQAGHTLPGKGASGLRCAMSDGRVFDEGVEAREVKDKLIRLLERDRKHHFIVNDCTIDRGYPASFLPEVVHKCNECKSDYNIAIHFNHTSQPYLRRKLKTGTEAYVTGKRSRAYALADKICNSISGLGYCNNGVHYRYEYYFLRSTVSPSIYIECCYIDNEEDMKMYDSDKMAKAIYDGICCLNTEFSR